MRLFRLFLLMLLPVLFASCEDDSVSSPIPAQKSILSIVPDSAYDRDTVSILGSGFGGSIENIKVKFGEKDVQILSVSDSVIQLVCPLLKVAETDVSVSFDGEEVENDLVFYPKWYYFILPEKSLMDFIISVKNVDLIYEHRLIYYYEDQPDSTYLDTVFNFSDDIGIYGRSARGKYPGMYYFDKWQSEYCNLSGQFLVDSSLQIAVELDLERLRHHNSMYSNTLCLSVRNVPFVYYSDNRFGAILSSKEEIQKKVKIRHSYSEHYPVGLDEHPPHKHNYSTISVLYNESSEVNIEIVNH